MGGYIPLEVEQSLAYVSESLEVCRQKHYLFLEAECLFITFSIIGPKGEIELAKTYLEQGLVICKDLADLDGIATRLCNLGRIAMFQGEYTQARALVKEGLTYYRAVGNLESYRGWPRFVLLMLEAQIGGDPDAVYQAEEGLKYYRETQDILSLIDGTFVFAFVEWSFGNFERAERFAQEVLALNPYGNLDFFGNNIDMCLGRLALTQGKIEQAGQHFKNQISNMTEAGVRVLTVVEILDSLAVFLTFQNQMALAVKIFSAVDVLYFRFSPGLYPRQRSEHNSALASARAALGKEAYSRIWAEGQGLTLWQALEEVRQAEGWDESHE